MLILTTAKLCRHYLSLAREGFPDGVVYLDDAHTRGTDLELPQGMRAAVTLGPKVTKDRLVQGRPIHQLKKKKKI